MQVSPWLGLGPWLLHLTHFSFGGTSLPEGALDQGHGIRGDRQTLLTSEGLPCLGQGKATVQVGDAGVLGSAPLTPRIHRRANQGPPGTEATRDRMNYLVSEKTGRWLPNTTARRQTQKLRNTTSTTKGTPALLRNYQVAPPAGLSNALNPAPLPAHGPIKQNRG